MTAFSRSQQGVILLLGAALIAVWAWRGHVGRTPAAAVPVTPVFVEVEGAAARPGVYVFTAPPTLPEVWNLAGASPVVLPPSQSLESGARVSLQTDGAYAPERMRGVRLITLGLPVDLNRATQEDLEALPGVGPALAARILAYRRSHGPFKRVEDLEEVQGIGPKVLAVIKPHVIIGSLGPAMRRPPNKP